MGGGGGRGVEKDCGSLIHDNNNNKTLLPRLKVIHPFS